MSSRVPSITNAFSSHAQIAEVEEQLEEAQQRIAELEVLNQKLQAVSDQQISPVSTNEIDLPIEQIARDPEQIRRYFDPVKLASLTASIEEVGVRERLWVRQLENDKYLLIAGERRYRAAINAGLKKVPVVILDVDHEAALKLSLIENLQREDLNAVEETEGVLKLLSLQLDISEKDIVTLLNRKAHLDRRGEDFDEVTENVFRNQWQALEQIFSVIGKFSPESFRVSRLPLLNLPPDVQQVLRAGELEYTKARAISRVEDEDDRKALLKEAIDKNLSFAEIQAKVKNLKPTSPLSMRDQFKAVLKTRSQSWDDPKKAKKLQSLLGQLQSLLAD